MTWKIILTMMNPNIQVDNDTIYIWSWSLTRHFKIHHFSFAYVTNMLVYYSIFNYILTKIASFSFLHSLQICRFLYQIIGPLLLEKLEKLVLFWTTMLMINALCHSSLSVFKKVYRYIVSKLHIVNQPSKESNDVQS